MPYLMRFHTFTRGAITFTGNTLGLSRLDSPTSLPICTPGTQDAIGAFIVNDPTINCGTYTPSPATSGGTTNDFHFNNSCNQLDIPPGSEILYAELIWGGSYRTPTVDFSGQIDNPIHFTTPVGLFDVNPETFFNFAFNPEGDLGYIRSANVTDFVRQAGAGNYCSGGIEGTLLSDPRHISCAGWTLGVVYFNPNLPFRSMSLYVGNVNVQPNETVTDFISDFQTGLGPTKGRLLISAQEGDANITGDFLNFGPDPGNLFRIPQPQGFLDNFFQSQIYDDNGFINPSATFGDRNSIAGEPGVNNPLGGRQGWDIANVDVSFALVNSQNSAVVQIGTQEDALAVNALALQIDIGNAELFIEKLSTPNQVSVGDQFEYTIFVTNKSEFPLTNVVVTDVLPPEVSFVSVTSSQGFSFESGGVVTADLGDLFPGTTAIVTITVVANQSGTILNTAMVTSNETEPSSATTETIVEELPPPVLMIQKESRPDIVEVGEVFDYVITISNIGLSDAHDVVLTDELPFEVDILNVFSPQGSCSITNNIVTCFLGTLPPGETTTTIITVVPKIPGIIKNIATVSSFETGPETTTTETIVNPGIPNLFIDKFSTPNPVGVGEKLTYQINIFNQGPSFAENVIVTDDLPPNVILVDINSPHGNCSFSGNIVSCDLGTLAPGEFTTITLTVIPTTVGTIFNVATVTAEGGAPISTENVTDVLPAPPGTLQIKKDATPNPVFVGSELLYTISIANTQNIPLTNVIFMDQLPANVTLVSIDSPIGNCSESGGLITCNLGILQSGESVFINIRVIPTTPGVISNTATVTSDETTPESATIDVIVEAPLPNLVVSKTSSPNPVVVGQQLVYTITVENTGLGEATNVVVTDTLPANVNFIDVNSSQGNSTETGGIVTTDLGTLPPGKIATILITVVPTTPGLITNIAATTSNETPEPIITTTDTIVESLPPPILIIEKIATPNPVVIGNQLTYTINVKNIGQSTANNVVVTDVLPANVVIDSVTTSKGSSTVASGVVTANIGTLDPRESATINIIVTPTEAGTLTNTATVTSDETSPETTTSESVVIQRLFITKVATPNPIQVGETLTYTITISNLSNIPMTGVLVGDTLPADVQLVTVNPSQGTCTEVSGIISCDIGTIPSLKIVTITVAVIPQVAGSLTNTATVTSDQTPAESAEATVTVLLAPPVSNVSTECICVPKIYDFVIFTEDINTTIPLPAVPPVGCPTMVTDIACTLVTVPTFFPITCETNGVCTVLDRSPITVNGVDAALVKLRQEIPIDVTLTGTDATGATATCTIALTVPFIRQVVLCFPPEFTNNNLICRIISGDCTITTPPPVGGVPFPASVGVELNVCKEIQVIAAVKLEILARFCSPRAPIDVPMTSVCPSTLFPEQCSFFPAPNCNCEATFNSTASVPTEVGVVVNSITIAAGTADLIGTVCNSCTEGNTSITFTFTDTDGLPPNNSFTFTANSFTSQECTTVLGASAMLLTGTGTVVTAIGDTIPVGYTLTLIDAGTIDSYTLSLSSIIPGLFTATATTVDIGNAIIIRDCNIFPTPRS